MPQRLARTISILGHPLLTLPLAILALSASRDPASLRAAAIGTALVGAAVMAYSWRQVKRARWAHIDASQPGERAGLNRVLSTLLAALTIFAALRGAYALALVLALSATLVLIAMALTRWCKLSLHVAFAAYAAGLLWALSPLAAAAAWAFVAAIAWSRLLLSRHRPRDVAIGAAVGTLAGLVAAVAYSTTVAQMEDLWGTQG